MVLCYFFSWHYVSCLGLLSSYTMPPVFHSPSLHSLEWQKTKRNIMSKKVQTKRHHCAPSPLHSPTKVCGNVSHAFRSLTLFFSVFAGIAKTNSTFFPLFWTHKETKMQGSHLTHTLLSSLSPVVICVIRP